MDDHLGFFERIEDDFNHCKKHGYSRYARDVNNNSKSKDFNEINPHYFTGDINAELVLVHLNPKSSPSDSDNTDRFKAFQDYLNYYRYFGKNHYGLNPVEQHKSRFDHKQIRYLRAFNIIPFLADSPKNRNMNLEMVIDNKLQLELIPYGSRNFDSDELTTSILEAYILNVINAILISRRSYVLFCGNIFDQILDKYISSKKTFNEHLPKVDGHLTKMGYSFYKVELSLAGINISAGIAPHFAIQGAPIEEYGKMCAKYY